MILTPTGETDRQALDKVSRLWQFVGAEVKLMSPAHHDEVLAQTSHLPHLLAYGLIDTLSRQGDSLEIFEYAAGGLRDFSRIAASDPTMWRDIFQSNRDAVLSSLDQFLTELNVLRGYIEQGEVDELMAVFARSKVARDHFSRLLADRQKPDDTD